MLNLPVEFTCVMLVFAPLFSKRVWQHVQVLVVGAILAPGKRTVTAILQVMGLSQEEHFQNYHRVLNRAVWSSRAVSRVLLLMLGSHLCLIRADCDGFGRHDRTTTGREN